MKLSDHEQVVLKAIEHVAGSRNGLASVPAVTRAVNYPISTTQKILAALHRKEIIALHHHDYPAQMTADEKKRAVKIGNDYFHAVAIRNPMKRGAAKKNPSPAQLKARAAFTRMAKARAKAAKKANPRKRRAANPRYLVSATDARGNIADLGVLVSPNKTQAVARAKKLYKGYKKFTAAMVDKGDYIGPKGVVKIRRKRPTKKANGIAKTAGKAIKKVTRAVLGGVSKVAGKGAKALKNPRMGLYIVRADDKNSGFSDSWEVGAKTAAEAVKKAKRLAGKESRNYTGWKASLIERYGNPKRRRNLDHRDSSHQVKVHQHWRAGGLSQWQRAHHAGQSDLFSHGIKAKAKRNPRKKRSVDEQLKQAELRKLKLFGKALKAFPSSPRQKRIHRDVMRMHDLAVRLKAKKANPSASAIRKKFAGRVSGQKTLYFPKGAPQGLAKLGRLVSIKLKGGKLIKPSRKNPSAEIWLCSDTSGKLWLGCTKAGPLYSGAPGDLGEMSVLEYAESKPHLGYANNTIWFHKMGEVSGRRPHLIVNDDQDLLIKGGNYKITRAGIVD